VTVRDFGNAISVVKLMHEQAAAEYSSLSCGYTARGAHVAHPVLCGTHGLDNGALYIDFRLFYRKFFWCRYICL